MLQQGCWLGRRSSNTVSINRKRIRSRGRRSVGSVPLGQEGAVRSKERQFVQRVLIGPQGASLSGGRRSADRAINQRKCWNGCACVDIFNCQPGEYFQGNKFIRGKNSGVEVAGAHGGVAPRGSGVAGAVDPATPVAPANIFLRPGKKQTNVTEYTYVCQISTEKQTTNSIIFRSPILAHLAYSWHTLGSLGSLLAHSWLTLGSLDWLGWRDWLGSLLAHSWLTLGSLGSRGSLGSLG